MRIVCENIRLVTRIYFGYSIRCHDLHQTITRIKKKKNKLAANYVSCLGDSLASSTAQKYFVKTLHAKYSKL